VDLRFDVLVIGGGMGGASAGYELSREGRVAVLEREDHLAFHSTGRSAAILMETYGNAAIRALTRASRGFLEGPPDGFTEEPLEAPRGTLVVGEPGDVAGLRARLAEIEGLVPGVEWLAGEELRRLVPCLLPGRWAGGIHEPGAVDLDVNELLQGFLRGLRARGGVVHTGAEVTAIARAGGLWTVTTGAGTFQAPLLVNAAGAWADVVGRLAGARPIGLVPMRRTAITFDAGLDPSPWPLVIDAQETFYFKPESRRLLVSPCDETPVEPGNAAPDDYDVAVAVDQLQRATTLEVRTIASRWAGLRSFVADRTPVVGPDPEVEGLVWLAGQGGYGIQTAPALARLCRSLALGQGVPADLAALGLEAAAVLPGRPGLQPA
jgi:D-arginine dehydrogenase